MNAVSLMALNCKWHENAFELDQKTQHCRVTKQLESASQSRDNI